MQQIKSKMSPKNPLWKISKREFGQFRKMYNLEVSYPEFQNYLNGLYVYYLNEIGLSINLNGTPVEKESAQYMWAQLDKTFNGKPLYVWMHQKGGGEYGNISLGTRKTFDKEIVTNHQK